MLLSMNDDNFCVGFSKDLKLRFEHHGKGLVEITKDRGPLILIYFVACIKKEM